MRLCVYGFVRETRVLNPNREAGKMVPSCGKVAEFVAVINGDHLLQTNPSNVVCRFLNKEDVGDSNPL